LADPVGQPLVEILDTDGVTPIGQVPATAEHTGIYYADWYVPATLPLGQYYDRWTYQWVSTGSVQEDVNVFTVHSLDNYINFISGGVAYDVSSRVLQLINDLTNEFIFEAQHIPIYFEQGMRIQQENQQKRRKEYYYFAINGDRYHVAEDSVYFNNSQRFTVVQSLVPLYSSSSSSSESEGNTSSSTSSSSSIDSSSSSSSSQSSSSSISSESILNTSSSSTSGATPTTTTTTTTWGYTPVLTTVGTGNPLATGTLAKISGVGPVSLPYLGVQKKESRFSTIYSLAYQNWNRDPRPIVRVNNTIMDDGWYSDYNGKIYMDGLMAPEDSINVAYNFSYFSPEEIMSFLDIGLKMMNATEPSSETYSTLVNMPSVWDAGVLLYAAVTALKRLIFGLNFQEKMIIFGEPEAAARAIAVFQGLYTDYLALWKEKAIEIKKRLPGIAQFVAPEYTLPGGRSRWFRYLYKSGSGG